MLRALAYPKLRKYLRGRIKPDLWFEDLVVLADLVESGTEVAGVCPDPDDDKYLAAALEGRADYIVTGDRRFLALGDYEGVRIVTPRVFLEILASRAQ